MVLAESIRLEAPDGGSGVAAGQQSTTTVSVGVPIYGRMIKSAQKISAQVGQVELISGWRPLGCSNRLKEWVVV